MSGRNSKSKIEAVSLIQEALPRYELRYKAVAKKNRHGETGRCFVDGFPWIGWRVAVIAKDGSLLDETIDDDMRDRRGGKLPRPGAKKPKSPLTTFNRLQEVTQQMRVKHKIPTERIRGDFLTDTIRPATGLNRREMLGGSVYVGDYLLMTKLTEEMTRRKLGDFAIKIDPEHEMDEGRIHVAGVGEGSNSTESKPWEIFTVYSRLVIPAYGHLRSIDTNHAEASGLAIGVAFPNTFEELLDRTPL